MLQRFLFRWHLDDGVIVIAVFTFVLQLIVIGVGIYLCAIFEPKLYEPKSPKYYYIYAILMGIITAICSILLIIGFKKSIRDLVGTYIIVYLFCMVASMMLSLAMLFKKDYLIGGLACLFSFVYGYCIIVVWSFYDLEYGED